MATALFVVRASIAPEHEDAFNRWYDTEHCPQLLQFRGAVSARRYKAILGEDRHQYTAVYEFESERPCGAFSIPSSSRSSSATTTRASGMFPSARSAYVQVWP